ncbi:MAG: DedA family protein [Spirochaetia bacterium]|nr:DedA family protein [Spirochaetia bacterium]
MDKNSLKKFTTSSYFKLDGSIDWKNIVKKAIVLISVFLLFFILLFFFLKPQMQFLAMWITETLGYQGVFLYTLIVDMFILPLTVDLIFPFVTHYNTVEVLFVISIASAIGGMGGYLIGRLLGHLKIIRIFTSGFTHDGEHLIRKYGVWAVVIAAITPIPFSTICWMSGMVKVPFWYVALATLARFPRMILYYAAVQAGLMIIL